MGQADENGKQAGYNRPPIELLVDYDVEDKIKIQEECKETAKRLEAVLEMLCIPAKVVNVIPGGVVSLYELKPYWASRRIEHYFERKSEITFLLGVEHPIRINRRTDVGDFGIEISNQTLDILGLKEILQLKELETPKEPLEAILGKTTNGEPLIGRFKRSKQIVIAGDWGQENYLKAMMLSLIFRYSPEELRFMILEQESLEFDSQFDVYENAPHMLCKPIAEEEKIRRAVAWVDGEVRRRYRLIQEAGKNDINNYNANVDTAHQLYHLLVIVNDYSELMGCFDGDRQKFDTYMNLQDLAPCVGIHYVVGMRGSYKEISKPYVTDKISIGVSSYAESMMILNSFDAVRYSAGVAPLWYKANAVLTTRAQGTYVSDPEIKSVVQYVSEHNPQYRFGIEFDELEAKQENTELDCYIGQADLPKRTVKFDFHNPYQECEEEEFRNPPKIDMAPYQRPPLDLLARYTEEDDTKACEECEEKAAMLEKTFEDFRIPAKVVNITIGPTVTRYELQIPDGVSVHRIIDLTDDIAMCFSMPVRIEAPIPGKNLFGIEIPNSTRRTVGLREIVDSREFEGNSSPVAFALGKGISGENVICDIAKMPHLLIAGTTGSGKSVCLNTIILSILYKSSPEDVRIILIDPKRVEFSMFEGLPNLMLKNIITEPEKAIAALNWAITEMNYRFEVFKRNGVKDIASYNARIDPETEQKFCRIVIIIDELAELMMGKNKQTIEDNIKRLTQLSRAAGIHLVVATQRSSVDVITGAIKSNMPSRIALSVCSQADSRTVLDQIGAESLIGDGDMLYIRADMRTPMRLQGAYVSSDEVEAVVNYVCDHNEAYYDQSLEDMINAENREEASESESGGDSEEKSMLRRILKMGIEQGSLSILMVQRSFELSYVRAGKMIDKLEKLGYISKFENAENRRILITEEEFKELFPDEE